jgi:hypothetical protein
MITSERNGHYLSFDDELHLYQLDGEIVPGVTDIKKAYPPSEAIIKYWIKGGIEEYESQKKLKAQASVGSIMHDFAHAKRLGRDYSLEPFVGHPDEEKIRARCAEIDKWLREAACDRVVMAEEIIASPKHGYGGKMDVVVQKPDGRMVLQDYKSSKGFYVDQFIQGGGYAVALEEWEGIKIDAIEIIRVNENTPEPASLLLPNVEDFKEQFIRCRYTRAFQRLWDTYFDKLYRQGRKGNGKATRKPKRIVSPPDSN